MTLTEAEQKRRVADAERRVADANRRAADSRAAERRTEEVANAERRATEAEQRAVEAERHANASVAARPIITRPSQAKPITAPAPNGRLTKEDEVMSTRKKALLRDVESASARLESARQGLEDAKFLARNCMGGDIVFATLCLGGSRQQSKPRVCGVPELQRLTGMARKNTIREARLASQAYAATLRRLTTAQALHSPDTLELSAAEFIAHTNHQRAMREL